MIFTSDRKLYPDEPVGHEKIRSFAHELQDLLEENRSLREEKERIELYMKLIICVKGSVDFRSIQHCDEQELQQFIKDTNIHYSSEINLSWKKKVPTLYNGITVMGMADVTIEEIGAIFNDGF